MDTQKREEADSGQIASQVGSAPVARKNYCAARICSGPLGTDSLRKSEVDVHPLRRLDVLPARLILCLVLSGNPTT